MTLTTTLALSPRPARERALGSGPGRGGSTIFPEGYYPPGIAACVERPYTPS